MRSHSGVNGSKVRRARSRDFDGAAGDASSLLSVRSAVCSLLLVLIICGWQFLLLTRQVEVPDAQVPGQGNVNEAVWHYLGLHEANLTAQAFQHRDLARVVTALSNDVRQLREDMLAFEGRLRSVAKTEEAIAHTEKVIEGLKDKQNEEMQELHRVEDALNQLAKHGKELEDELALGRHRMDLRSTELEKISNPNDLEDGGDTAEDGASTPTSPAGNANPEALAREKAELQRQAEAHAERIAMESAREPGDSSGRSTDRKRGEWPAAWLQRFSAAELEASAQEAEKWRAGSKDMFVYAWNGYKRRAWGADELKPVSGQRGRTWGNVGLQILDALDTMWIMDLHEVFDEAAQWVEKDLRFDFQGMVSFFELTIRAVGGLAAAHALSGRSIFLKRARELADKMMPAFQSQEPFFPAARVHLKTGQGAGGWFKGTLLAEAGSVQLEFRYLSQVTGDPKYQRAADRAMRSVIKASGDHGLVGWGLSKTGPPRAINTHITFGAMGDSYYEYLLKMYLQTSRTEPEWKDQWLKAMDEMQQRLIKKTRSGLVYIAEENKGKTRHKMDHLACFVGGMLVLGARELPARDVRPEWESVGANITETCYQMYHRQPTHLAPECVALDPGQAPGHDMVVWNNAAHYLLRPEAAEAIFYMFYYTGDPKYRRMAGEIYEAIERHAKVTHGYSAVKDVRSARPQLRDEMETFFLAETMKYLYLTFVRNPQDVLDLGEFVLTTEAHPMRIHRPSRAQTKAQAKDAFLARAPVQ